MKFSLLMLLAKNSENSLTNSVVPSLIEFTEQCKCLDSKAAVSGTSLPILTLTEMISGNFRHFNLLPSSAEKIPPNCGASFIIICELIITSYIVRMFGMRHLRMGCIIVSENLTWDMPRCKCSAALSNWQIGDETTLALEQLSSWTP